MINLSDPLTRARVACGTCTGVAILTTIVRISVRIRRSKLWIDDALAVFSMSALITQLVAVFLNPNRSDGVARYYLMSNMFYAAIWSARLSILFSIIRITHTHQPNRILHAFGVLFLLAWLILTAQLYWECETKTAWKHTEIPQCNLSVAVAICQLIADIVSDSVLLLAPIRLFMIIKDRKLRYRAMMIFGTCIVTTIVSVVHAAYIFQSKEEPILISAFIENAVSLIVCNIPIIVTAIIKLQKKDNFLKSSQSGALPRFHKPADSQLAPGASIYSVYLSKTTFDDLNSRNSSAQRI